MFKFLVLLLLPASIYATEFKQCLISNIKVERANSHYGMSHKPKLSKPNNEWLFAYNMKMKPYTIDGAIQLGWSRVASNCGKFYHDVATFTVLTYDESGVSQYRLNHRLSF